MVDITATDVEDSLLRGAAEQPPAGDPIGKGLLTAQQMSGGLSTLPVPKKNFCCPLCGATEEPSTADPVRNWLLKASHISGGLVLLHDALPVLQPQ